ncbi:MAG: hypothetical protein D6679_08310 [Candidatus Hydrogenedentota bacterium]|nr:MAG: hypothetical protein D6679_08310 [Candidatus Hydrogenedentota bacterium]
MAKFEIRKSKSERNSKHETDDVILHNFSEFGFRASISPWRSFRRKGIGDIGYDMRSGLER